MDHQVTIHDEATQAEKVTSYDNVHAAMKAFDRIEPKAGRTIVLSSWGYNSETQRAVNGEWRLVS